MKRFFPGLAGLAALCLLSGCETTDSPASPSTPPAASTSPAPETEAQPTKSDIIQVGNKIIVSLTDIPGQYGPTDLRVRDDGTISLPLNVEVRAADKRVADLEREIHDIYVPKYYTRMSVSVKLEQRVFYVRGYVRLPNRFPYEGEITVLKAISVAGDFNEYANKRKVELTRPDGKKYTVDCKKAQKNPKLDLPVFPGDTIYVPPRIM